MKVVNYVQIDFSKNKDITVPSMQYDSGSRWVRLKLFNNGIPVNLNGIRVCIMVAKPDGKEVFNDCVIVDAENGLVEFEITNQMVVVAGEVECQIKLMEQDKLLSSEIFTLFVNKGLTPTNIDSENELNVLVDALNRVEHLDQELSGEIMASFEASQTQRDETFKEKLLEYDERFLEIKGEKGDKGDKGDTGERGLQGPVGPQGSKGDVGEQGPVGPQGPKGDKGDQGEVGAIGPIGLQGPIGLTGPQGETGPQGPKGEKGLDGRSVELGVYGGQVKWRYAGQEENVGWTPLISLDSLRGSQGPQGEKGETGPQGPKGEKGDSGGVMPADMVDYMGNQHETLKAKNDADVDWLLGEINTAHYEGQQITATDSIEGRAKSAILKGNTLVNLFPIDEVRKALPADWKESSKGVFEYTSSSTARDSVTGDITLTQPLIAGKTYILKHDSDNTTDCARIGFVFPNETTGTWYQGAFVSSGTLKPTQKSVIYTPNKDIKTVRMGRWNGNYVQNTTVNIKYPMILEYQQGMENWDIPYFDGIQSVKMPVLRTVGKNLFDSTMSYGFISDSNGTINTNAKDWLCSDYVKLNKGTYTISSTEPFNGTKKIAIYDNNTTFVKTTTSTTFVLDNDGYVRVGVKLTGSGNILEEQISLVKLQIEVGTQATSFEQHKTNILSIDGEYRGIGDVCDTVDCMTGEVVERIGEIVLDGSENWVIENPLSNDEYIYFKLNDPNTVKSNVPTTTVVNVLTDKLKISSYAKETSTKSNSYFQAWTSHFIGISRTELSTQDVVSFKEWLSNNNILIQYPLSEKSIKTVDLSDYHVYSFKDTTHYSCGSEDGSLIPSLSIDVPTNLPALVSRQRATIESQKEQIQTLEVENEILTNEIQRVDEKGEQADLEQLSMTWEIDYRVSEVEWFLEDNLSSTLLVAEKINLKLGGNTMALSRFEQAKILILAGAYNRETLEKQLTNYLKRGYLTTEEYDELIALMDAKELVSEN